MQFIPISGKKSLVPYGNGETYDPTIIHPNQTGIGILTGPINGNLVGLDIDRGNIFEKYRERLFRDFALTKSPNHVGHVYALIRNLPHESYCAPSFFAGELKIRKSYLNFPHDHLGLSLPPSKYSFLNDFDKNLKEYDSLEVFEGILPKLYIENLYRAPLCAAPKAPDTICMAFSLESYLPNGPGQNNKLIYKLLTRIKTSGLWDQREVLFKEWLRRNRHKREPESSYWGNFYVDVKQILKKGIKTYSIDALIAEARSKIDPNIKILQSKQFIYHLALILSRTSPNNTFYLSCNSFRPELDPKTVFRALQWLEGLGAIRKKGVGQRWGHLSLTNDYNFETGIITNVAGAMETSNLQMPATEYEFLNEIDLRILRKYPDNRAASRKTCQKTLSSIPVTLGSTQDVLGSI